MNKRKYTLITGASEGLGKSMAIECASRGMNIILVALPGESLSCLARFLQNTFAVSTKVFAMDLSEQDNCHRLLEKIEQQKLNINILINNAGIGGTSYFEGDTAEQYTHFIKLNVLAPTLISRLFLENLKQNSPSYILNTGSMAGFFHLPNKQVYGGTKAFIYSFSRSLQKELKSRNIHVGVLCPGGMNTSIRLILMQKSEPLMNRLSIMDPEEVASIAINGLLKRKNVIVPGRMNRFLLIANKILPEFLKKIIMKKTIGKINPLAGYCIYDNMDKNAAIPKIKQEIVLNAYN